MANETLDTLIYSDLFDFPLNREELERFLHTKKKKKPSLSHKGFSYKNGYFFLKGRERIISIRKSRQKDNQKKLGIAKKAAGLLTLIPYIKLIGVSGSLAVGNAKKEDDIDLFLITEQGRVWTSRLYAVLLLKLLGLHRGRNTKNNSNKICLNMVVSEDKMSYQKPEHNIYLAREIAQMLPLLNRDGVYEKFIAKNNWIKKFLANYYPAKIPVSPRSPIPSLFLSEFIAKKIQLSYMMKRRGKEKIKEGFLAFHPEDNSSFILDKYKDRGTTRGH
jgi:predicted nucleotidyltransferase